MEPQSLQAGSNESQDSQAIFEAYRAEFGVGRFSSPLSKFELSSRNDTDDQKQIVAPTSEVVVPSSEPTVNEKVTSEAADSHDALTDTARSVRPASENGDPSHWDETGVALTHSKKQCTLKTSIRGGVTQDREDRVNLIADRSKTPGHDILINPQDLKHLPARHDSAKPQAVQNDALKPLTRSTKPPNSAAAGALHKMDFSQQTPTQANFDRDYSEFCDFVPSSPVEGDTQSGSLEPRPLEDDDTGAVNFANLSEFGRPSSQVSEDAGFENTRGDWRHPDGTSQLNNGQTPHRPNAPTFETPAVPKNPFVAKPNITAPLAGSQLFGQTQFSSAVKRISPTSSRPSPKLFNSKSPNLIETSPLKNRANVSSPTDIRTSSPLRLHEIPETLLTDEHRDSGRVQTPRDGRSAGGDTIPESPPSSEPTPRAQAPRSSSTTEPMSHYEPMQKSQERKIKILGSIVISPMNSDDDSDDAIRRMERRKKIERKKAQAAEELGRVSFTPKIWQDSMGQPSRKRRKLFEADNPEVSHATSHVDTDVNKRQELPAIVDDSQKGLVASNELPVASTKATPGNSAPENQQVDHDGDMVLVDADKVMVDEDMIPATSPAPSLPPTAPVEYPEPSEPELPRLRMDDEDLPEGPNNHSEPSSLPPPRRRTVRTYGRTVRQKRRNPFLSSSNSDGLMGETEPRPMSMSSPLHKTAGVSMIEEESEQECQPPQETIKVDANPTSRPKKMARDVYANLPPPMTTRSRRSGRAETTPVTPLASRSAGQILPTSSSLSILSTTPTCSAKTTPGTQDSPGSEQPESVTLPSPGGNDSLRKGHIRLGTKSESPQQAGKLRRISKRYPRLDSESTDELHHSPAASVLERSIGHKSSRSFKQSFAFVPRTGRLFDGMVFALSFSTQFKAQERKKIESKITQSGGAILTDGFQDMFEHSSIMSTMNPVMDEEEALRLTKTSCESGFTALIADNHSRKVKYMQALALGLPCLAPQWITACLNKGAIVDWEPYLLCAGASTVLGNALRSRILTPYSAAEARLADVIEQRPRLLDGQRVLVVVNSKKSRNEAKEPYIFLASVLGPSISRVFSTQQARELLLEQQKAGNPFDWLYLDKGTGTVEAVLAPAEIAGNKRRRKSTPAQANTTDIRVLDDELVIQSLILGRMVEENEMYT
ncbi:hypothetical protein FPOA_07683 [Fusarium poae]|uniref:BRCT domain-containing protein n=1 Tax=Fusarium poae TaxID=36050 RepID=A0A1B8AL92_FUSPO|nr:hypothetical protein FPOA_07683 [Fusarium poae]